MESDGGLTSVAADGMEGRLLISPISHISIGIMDAV